MPRKKSRKRPARPLTPITFRRRIAKQLAIVRAPATTTKQGYDKLRAYYQIGTLVNRHFPGRSNYGDNQFVRFAEALGHRSVWLYETRLFAQNYAPEDLDELFRYEPSLHWSHVRLLLAIHNKQRRRQLQRLAVKHGWTTERLRQEIRSRMGPGQHRGRSLRGLDSPQACLQRLTELTRKWTRFAEAAVERGSGPLVQDDITGCSNLRATLRDTQEALAELKSSTVKIQRRLKHLAESAGRR
jgi:hypothetical protein